MWSLQESGPCKYLSAFIITDTFLINILISKKYTSCDVQCVFLQIYEKVAAAFKSDEDVVIANLDADKHKGLGEK